MPVTKLDPSSALVLIDLQKGVVGLPTVHPAGDIIVRAAQLARAFRECGLPVVLVNVTAMAPGRTEAGRPKFAFPDGWTELVPELEKHPNDYLVTKQRVGAFHGTSLDSYLRERGVTQVVLAGISTSSGVEATARRLRSGLPRDACGRCNDRHGCRYAPTQCREGLSQVG